MCVLWCVLFDFDFGCLLLFDVLLMMLRCLCSLHFIFYFHFIFIYLVFQLLLLRSFHAHMRFLFISTWWFSLAMLPKSLYSCSSLVSFRLRLLLVLSFSFHSCPKIKWNRWFTYEMHAYASATDKTHADFTLSSGNRSNECWIH